MPLFINTTGNANLGVGVCGRCSVKHALVDLRPDRNATGLMRRNVEETPATPPQRAEPVASQQPRPPQPMRPAQQQPDEMGLDIPTFLRRQSN